MPSSPPPPVDAEPPVAEEPPPSSATPSPPSSVSPSTTPSEDAAALQLSPLPSTPPRTSSTISSSCSTNLFPHISRNSFARGVTAVLAIWTSACVSLPSPRDKHSLYYGIHRPTIATKDYVDRLLQHMHCSPSAFVVALVYLRRIARYAPSLKLCPENLHRLVVTALTLAVKLLDDRVFSMRHYARVGGVPSAAELARLELQFLVFVRARVFVSRKSFLRMLDRVWQMRDHPLASRAAAKREVREAAAAAPQGTQQSQTQGASTSGTARNGSAGAAAAAAATASSSQHVTTTQSTVPGVTASSNAPAVQAGGDAATAKGVTDTGPCVDDDVQGRPAGTGGEGRDANVPQTYRAEVADTDGERRDVEMQVEASTQDDATGTTDVRQKPAEERVGHNVTDQATDPQAATSAAADASGIEAATTTKVGSDDGDESRGQDLDVDEEDEQSGRDAALTVQTAEAEKGKPPVFGRPHSKRRIERPEVGEAGSPEDFTLGPAIEEDSGVLDDSEDDDGFEESLDVF